MTNGERNREEQSQSGKNFAHSTDSHAIVKRNVLTSIGLGQLNADFNIRKKDLGFQARGTEIFGPHLLWIIL
jgi:hypothetical protein